MEINLSDKSIKTIMIALRDARKSLYKQRKDGENAKNSTRVNICEEQIRDVEDVIAIFEELGY